MSYTESYVKRGRYKNYPVMRFTIHYESKKRFVIPQENYLWSTDTPMSDGALLRYPQGRRRFGIPQGLF